MYTRRHFIGQLSASTSLAAIKNTALIHSLLAGSDSSESAAKWLRQSSPLMTRWSSQVDPNHPLPEYPRPQFVRERWLNLNGIWEFQPGQEGDAPAFGKSLSRKICVPFGVESALSGIMEHHDRIWYRKLVRMPEEWADRDVLLHFGAVDWESEVYVNGKSIGIHRGGYDPHSYNIKPYLSRGDNEIIVRVFDPTEFGGQPRGKQTTKPGGIMYTPTTGIHRQRWEPRYCDQHTKGGFDRVPCDTVSEALVTGLSVSVRRRTHVAAGWQSDRSGAELHRDAQAFDRKCRRSRQTVA